MKIKINYIPQNKQRNPEGIGDYFIKNNNLQINITDLPNFDHSFLITIHELIEWYTTYRLNINEESIQDFDMYHNTLQLQSEPGDHPEAPYRHQHRFSENIERLIAHEMGIEWSEYEQAINDHFKENQIPPTKIDEKVGK